jgi:hypothetical protein
MESRGWCVFAIVLTLLLASCCDACKADSPLAVHVQGNHLVDASGNTLRLLGIERSGAEYECLNGSSVFDGPVDTAAIAAIATWNVNAVRVPLNEDCWLGINLPANNPVIGSAYQQAIVAFVQALNSAGMYVILDLHWNAPGTSIANQQQPMADLDHGPAFWSSVAATFNGFPGVIFDLYNEPYVGSWTCWRDGCSVSNSDGTWSTAGMTQLVNAVRAAGATQPIMLGGLQYASDLSQWLAYEPVDPVQGPAQLVASYHSYCGPPGTSTVAACQTALPLAAPTWSVVSALATSVPVVTGEFGEYDCATTYVTPYMGFADAYGISYLGWAWDTYGCGTFPALISDYSGTPTAYGIGLKSHLAALSQPLSLLAAVLPESRSVQVGGTATAFATIINTGTTSLSGCSIAAVNVLPLTFVYQTTNPATNTLTGSPNTPANIAAGASQSFVIAMTPSAAFAPADAAFIFSCTNVPQAPVVTGLNTLLLSASTTPTPDVIALVATLQNDGIVHVTHGSPATGVFAVASDNLGSGDTITVATNTGEATLPVTIAICQTNPATGVCLQTPAASVATPINPGATPTFGVFVTASGTVPFDPTNNRIFVTFTDSRYAARPASRWRHSKQGWAKAATEEVVLPIIATYCPTERPVRVINSRQTMSALAAAFFESSRRGRGRPAGLILDVGAGRHPRRGGGGRLARDPLSAAFERRLGDIDRPQG